MIFKRENGRPSDFDNRVDIEKAVYEMLDILNIDYTRVDHDPAFTMEACAEIDRFLSPASICKNLLLCNSQKTSFYLLMINGDKKFKTKDLSRQIGSARLSFAPGEYMVDLLGITPGSLSVLGLMNDKDHRVKLLIDSDVIGKESVVCHPCINTSSLVLRTEDLLDTILPSLDHDYTVVRLDYCEE